jgi:radical SAM enzyme (TIGR01210 family)
MKQSCGSPLLVADARHHYQRDYVTLNKRERYSDGLRWKLGINTNPCVQLRRGKRCVYCGFLNNHDPVPPQKIGRVFGDIFTDNNLDEIHRLELYVSGSFFDDEEVSSHSRLEITKLVDESGIAELLLESRPEFITDENLQSLASIIEPERVTIAIGVETMDDSVRNKLQKGFSTKELVKSLSKIARYGMNFQAYLLLNPPSINNDKKAILDIISSSIRLVKLAEEMNCNLVLAIQPYFIAQNSLAANSFSKTNRIRPPWLYTVALTLKILNTMRARTASNWQIILGNENDNVIPLQVASNYTTDGYVCPCTETARKYLNEFNISPKKMEESINRILNSSCECKKIWESQIGSKISKFQW